MNPTDSNKTDSIRQNEYIFSLSSSLSEAEIREVFAGFKITFLTEINKSNLSYKIKFLNDPGIKVLEERVQMNGKFRYIELNSLYKKNNSVDH